MSEAADVELWPFLVAAPATEGSELSAQDVDPRRLTDDVGIDADPERPLSRPARTPADSLCPQASVPAGETTRRPPCPP